MTTDLLSRRNMLICSSSAAAWALTPPVRARAALADHAQLAEEAFIWGMPLVLMGRYLDVAKRAGCPFNQFMLSMDLSTPQTTVPGPNADTLYGLAWLDLSAGPQVLEVPDTADRYYSIQLNDMYANVFDYVGRRTTGTKAGRFAITPPGFRGRIPGGMTEIKAPTSKILAFARTLILGKDDLEAARAIHGQYRLGALSEYPRGRLEPVVRDESINILPFQDFSKAGAGFFEELNARLAQFPPAAFDRPALRRFAPVGVGAGRSVPTDAALRSVLAAAVPVAYTRVRQANFATTINGWNCKFGVTNYIRDPLMRANVAMYGPATHVAEEALYFSTATGPDGAHLSGSKRYVMHFPAGQLPPVDSFWSLTLYSGRLILFVANPIERYAIGERTPGLQYDPDGSLDLLIQHEPPAEGTSNWLPAPAGDFQVSFRTYQPRRAILDRTYTLPALRLAT